jgi:hypothetical protein
MRFEPEDYTLLKGVDVDYIDAFFRDVRWREVSERLGISRSQSVAESTGIRAETGPR